MWRIGTEKLCLQGVEFNLKRFEHIVFTNSKSLLLGLMIWNLRVATERSVLPTLSNCHQKDEMANLPKKKGRTTYKYNTYFYKHKNLYNIERKLLL